MRPRTVALTGIVAVVLIGWVILDADRTGTANLWSRVTAMFQGEPDPDAQPNWGDVATRIGVFTDEERDLREVLNQTGPVAPEPPAAEPAPATP